MQNNIMQFDHENQGDQFKAEMLRQEHPAAIMFSVDATNHQAMLSQKGGENFITLRTPEVMRRIGKLLIEFAGKWERGELPDLTGLEKSSGTNVTEGA